MGVPSLYEFKKNLAEVQASQGIFADGAALPKQLVEKLLEALVEHDSQTVQDVKNEGANASVSTVIEYLVTHHGQPATIESLAKARHESIGQLIRTFPESNISMTFVAIKGHRSTMNSVSTMVKYF